MQFHLASDSSPNNKNIPVIFSGVHGFTGKTVVTFAMTFLKSYKNDISILISKLMKTQCTENGNDINRIYNTILYRDWYSAHLFVT